MEIGSFTTDVSYEVFLLSKIVYDIMWKSKCFLNVNIYEFPILKTFQESTLRTT